MSSTNLSASVHTNNVRLPRFIVLPLVALACLVAAGHADAGYYSPKYQGAGYSYRYYNYYSARSRTYQRHMLVYHPRQPRYVYYYNPYKGRYWGRFDFASGTYQLLAEQDRRATIGEIREEAFQTGGPMPPPEPGLEPMPMPPAEPGLQPAPLPNVRPTPPYVNLPHYPGAGCLSDGR